MCTFIWLMVGIILLAITIFVHRNTYEYSRRSDDNCGDKLPFPVWFLILAIGLTAIPILNVIAFAVGVIAYFIGIGEGDITFCCKQRWWKSLLGFLTKEV